MEAVQAYSIPLEASANLAYTFNVGKVNTLAYLIVDGCRKNCSLSNMRDNVFALLQNLLNNEHKITVTEFRERAKPYKDGDKTIETYMLYGVPTIGKITGCLDGVLRSGTRNCTRYFLPDSTTVLQCACDDKYMLFVNLSTDYPGEIMINIADEEISFFFVVEAPDISCSDLARAIFAQS